MSFTKPPAVPAEVAWVRLVIVVGVILRKLEGVKPFQLLWWPTPIL